MTSHGQTFVQSDCTKNPVAMQIYAASYAKFTAYDLKCIQKPRMSDIDIHIGVETHLRDAWLLEAQKKLQRSGWESTSSPAAPTAADGTLGLGGAWAL
eukprot:1274061-Pyramimonas_sp.AAC.1